MSQPSTAAPRGTGLPLARPRGGRRIRASSDARAAPEGLRAAPGAWRDRSSSRAPSAGGLQLLLPGRRQHPLEPRRLVVKRLTAGGGELVIPAPLVALADVCRRVDLHEPFLVQEPGQRIVERARRELNR